MELTGLTAAAGVRRSSSGCLWRRRDAFLRALRRSTYSLAKFLAALGEINKMQRRFLGNYMVLLPSPVLPHVVPDVVRHLAGAVDLPQEGEEGGDVHLGAEAGQGGLAPGVEGVALGGNKSGL